jgi:ATP-dependent Clp protease ATP-binding subunit ClpA
VVSSRYSHHARLSELSRRVIVSAEQRAAALGQPVGVGHLLLALLAEQRSPAAGMMRACGLDDSRLRAGLDARDALLLVSLEPVLARAPLQAERLGSHYTGTEHLLLALALLPAGAHALRAYSADADALAARLVASLT